MDPAKEFFSFPKLFQCAEVVAKQIAEKHPGAILLTISRGGWFAAGMIAAYLPWKTQGIVLSKEDLEERQEPLENMIFVDDILDVGLTAKGVFSMLGREIPTAFLLNKPGAHRSFTPRVAYSGHTMEDPKWVVFEWETYYPKNS